jgi:heavy metal translocating P-type ATPase
LLARGEEANAVRSTGATSQSRPDHQSFLTLLQDPRLLLAASSLGLAAGLGFQAAGEPGTGSLIFAVATIPGLLTLALQILRSLSRGEFGLDIVAALSMSAALLVGESLAAAVVALMYAGGQYLEAFAERRARREMTALLSGAPRTAKRHGNGELQQIPAEAIAIGDRLLVGHGEMVPADGVLQSGVAVLDQSALTGEAMPVRFAVGEKLLSGSRNAGNAFDYVVSQVAAASTYAGIVRLVEQAQQSKAPMARLADRFALAFLALTLMIAGTAWYLTGDPVRAVAVLVVATPCPLILAVPVALVSGLSRAAANGILIKSGEAIEALAHVVCLIIDKTGTITEGKAAILSVNTAEGYVETEVLRMAASLDQVSHHIVAETIVAAARKRGLPLELPASSAETAGEGVEGTVSGRRVTVGGRRFVMARATGTTGRHMWGAPGRLIVAVAIDGKLAGEIILADHLRPGVAALLQRIKQLGVRRIVLATGDRQEVAESVTAGLPVDAIRANLTPDQKVLAVLSERKRGPVMMVGDGVNDAPALAAADIGVAMGIGGSAASAEVADVVLLVERLDRIASAIEIASRSRRIALQSVYAGIGLSAVGMMAASLGYLLPVEGALFQEFVDVAVVLNALRALR